VAQLSSSPSFHLTVDQYVAIGDHGAGLSSALGDAGVLEELTQADHVATNHDALWFTHATSLVASIGSDHG